MLFLKAYFSSMNGKMSSEIYHIQATLLWNSCNEDDEHLIETVYYVHLKLVMSNVCKYDNLYITEMMFI